MNEKVRPAFEKTIEVAMRYPMVLTSALIAALSLVTVLELENSDRWFTVLKLFFTSALGISLFFAIHTATDHLRTRMLYQLVGLGLLGTFYLSLPREEKSFTEMYAFIILPSFVLSHLLVSFLAFVSEKKEQGFWNFNKNLFINVFLTGVFTGVLTLGTVLAILAVDKLFDLDLREEIYPKTAAFLGIFASTFIFLFFSGKGRKELEKPSEYPQILKFFTQFVLIPLLLIYVVILYLYGLKILINFELPRGWVSYLVLGYGLVGTLALLLVHPLRHESKGWVRLFRRIFYLLLMPLLVLLFVAIFFRILQYGFTEARYIVLLLSVWLTTMALYFSFFRAPTIRMVPISLFLLGLAGLCLPFVNMFDVSASSQKKELLKTLKKNSMLSGSTVDFSRKVSDSTAREIADKMNYLYERKQADFVLSLLEEKKQISLSKVLSKETSPSNIYPTVMGWFSTLPTPAKAPVVLQDPSKLIALSGYDYLVHIPLHGSSSFSIGEDTFTVHSAVQEQTQSLSLTLNGKEKVELLPLLKTMWDKETGQELSGSSRIGPYSIKIQFQSLERYGEPGRIGFTSGILLLKRD